MFPEMLKKAAGMALCAAMMVFSSCNGSDNGAQEVSVGEGTGTAIYAIGAEFDPHFISQNVTRNDGPKIEDWDNVILRRLDMMKPSSFRVMVLPTWYEWANDNDDPDTIDWDSFTFDSLEMQSLCAELDYAEKNGIKVTLVLWGACQGNWLAGTNNGNWVVAPEDYEEWAENFSALVQYLINKKGYTCIKQITPLNEPDWEYYMDGKAGPASEYMAMCRILDERFRRDGIRDKVEFNLADNSDGGTGTHSYLKECVEGIDGITDMFNSHTYIFGYETPNDTVLTWEKENVALAASAGKAHFVGEFGSNQCYGSARQRDIDWYDRGILMVRTALNALNAGAAGISYWSLIDQHYGKDGSYESMQQLGLWRHVKSTYACEPYYDSIPCDYSVRPQYYSYSLLTQFIRPDAEVHPLDVQDQFIAASAIRNKDGRWVYVFANQTDADKEYSVANAGVSGSFDFYRYKEDELPQGDSMLPVLKKASTSRGHLKVEVPAKSVVACVMEGKPEEAGTYSFSIDASRTSTTIPNLVSNINVWEMGETFVNPEVKSDVNIFDFVEYVQLMTATGGNRSRDLFQDPDNKAVKDDYRFDKLLANCRGILSLGAKPHIKFGNVPSKFTSKYSQDTFGVNIYSPDNYKEYYTYIRAIVEALVKEFGADEVKSWHYGVFTEYENKEWFQGRDGTPASAAEEFCKIYDWTVQAVIDVLGDDVWIGAHSMTVAEGLWDERIFIKHCAEGTNWANGGKGSHITYLASSFYDNEPGSFSKHFNLGECITHLKSTAEEYGLKDLAYGIDEGRILSGTRGRDDSALYSRTTGDTYMAANDARLYGMLLDTGGSYLSSWQYLSTGLFEGNPSVSCHVARNIHGMAGMKRAEVSAEASGTIPGAEVKVYAGTDPESGKTTLMVYNFGFSTDYDSEASVRLTVNGLSRGRHNVTISKVDDDCNWFDEWTRDRKEMGITDDMFRWSPDDACCMLWNFADEGAKAKYLEKVPEYARLSTLVPENGSVKVRKDGAAVFDCNLAPNAVWFIEID